MFEQKCKLIFNNQIRQQTHKNDWTFDDWVAKCIFLNKPVETVIDEEVTSKNEWFFIEWLFNAGIIIQTVKGTVIIICQAFTELESSTKTRTSQYVDRPDKDEHK